MDIRIIDYDQVNQDATIMFNYKENMFKRECRINLMENILKRYTDKLIVPSEEDGALFDTIIKNGGIKWLNKQINEFDIL